MKKKFTPDLYYKKKVKLYLGKRSFGPRQQTMLINRYHKATLKKVGINIPTQVCWTTGLIHQPFCRTDPKSLIKFHKKLLNNLDIYSDQLGDKSLSTLLELDNEEITNIFCPDLLEQVNLPQKKNVANNCSGMIISYLGLHSQP